MSNARLKKIHPLVDVVFFATFIFITSAPFACEMAIEENLLKPTDQILGSSAKAWVSCGPIGSSLLGTGLATAYWIRVKKKREALKLQPAEVEKA